MEKKGKIVFMKTTQKQELKTKQKQHDHGRKVKTQINIFQKNQNFEQIKDPHQLKHH